MNVKNLKDMIDLKYHEKESIMVNKRNKTWKEYHELKGYMDALNDVKNMIEECCDFYEF